MKINTYQFGEIEYSPELVIKFEDGLFGFEQSKHYLLIKTDSELFYWLNSVDQPELAFPVVGVGVIDENFPKEENYEAFGIVTLDQDPLKVTVNLKAPIYIDQNSKYGFQKIIDDDKYPIQYNLFVE